MLARSVLARRSLAATGAVRTLATAALIAAGAYAQAEAVLLSAECLRWRGFGELLVEVAAPPATLALLHAPLLLGPVIVAAAACEDPAAQRKPRVH